MRLDGVCAHPADFCAALGAADERVLVGVCGGDAVFVGLAWFAVDVRVARLRGEDSCAIAVAVSGSGNSLGWFRVATIFGDRSSV